MVMVIEPAFLVRLDTAAVYERIESKISAGKTLTDEELMELMVLPLTVKGNEGKQKAVISAVELARKLPEREQVIQALAGILTFSDKVIDKEYRERIKEEMRMTQIGQMLIEEGMEIGIQALILDNLEEGAGRQRILEKLMKRFSLDEGSAERFYDKYATDIHE